MAMDIIGPDTLVFGVEDLDGAIRFVLDFGLLERERDADGGIYEALDGTSLTIRRADDPSLPPPIAPSPNIRQVIYGCVDQDAVDQVAAELSKDRDVRAGNDGVISSHDDDGYPIAFQVTTRHALGVSAYGVNSPGTKPGRGINVIAADNEARPKAFTLSHVVLFTPDKLRAERFYAERLQFRTVDVFTNLGPFMRPKANPDHHTLFLIEAGKVGLEHFAFHMAGANELLKAGWEFAQKGYKSAWGPGRHILGSNYFWYFNSPFGGKMEFDADMDLHDDSWEPRYLPALEDTSQIYLFEHVAKWSPRGGPRH
jgi:catechol 2,3-dioxygenase-like lactoylglutathione lyase family enzyme